MRVVLEFVMSFDSDQSADGELTNKEETEIPIGEPREPASQAHHMWRCQNCGEMGRFERELPAACPGCDGPREELYYWEED